MQIRLSVWSLAAALLSAATVAFAAGQAGTHDRLNQAPPWVHKVPDFVCARVELVSGQVVAQPPALKGRESLAREQAVGPGGPNPICAHGSPTHSWWGIDFPRDRWNEP